MSLPLPVIRYSITVEIEKHTLQTLKKGMYHLVLIRDIGLPGGSITHGNIVFNTYESKDLSRKQTFSWEDTHSVTETTDEFKVSIYILSLMHTTDDWHVAWLRNPVDHRCSSHSARPESYH